MTSRRTILSDVKELGLDPKKAHRHISSSGRLKTHVKLPVRVEETVTPTVELIEQHDESPVISDVTEAEVSVVDEIQSTEVPFRKGRKGKKGQEG